MRVALDSRLQSDRGGVGRYSRCLLEALQATADDGDEVLDTTRPSALFRSRRADVIHAPWLDGAMLHSPCPMVVTVHDLIAHTRRSEYLRSGLRMRLRPLTLQRAAAVIVPTDAVAQDAVRHLRLDRSRITVVPEAADRSMYPRPALEIAQVRARFDLPERYLLWVGGLEHPDPDKHLAKLAATERELPLVLVGPTRPWAHELPSVLLTGPVGDDELAAIYSGAHALVVTSANAGFGLGAVEALACGTPVVACEGPALRETLGDRATFVPRGDMHALLETAQAVSRPAPPPLPRTWDDVARATWTVYREAAMRGTSPSPQRARRRRPAPGSPGTAFGPPAA